MHSIIMAQFAEKYSFQFLQFTESCYINWTPFHFRRRAEDAQHAFQGFSNKNRPSTPKKTFYTSKKPFIVLPRLSTARCLK